MTVTTATVTFTTESFVSEARAALAAATEAATAATDVCALARLRAAAAPADFHTLGGADAATVARFVADDLDSVRRYPLLIADALARTENADTIQHASWAAHEATVYARSARYDLDTMRRYLAYLPA